MPSNRLLALICLVSLFLCAPFALAQTLPATSKLSPDTVVARQGTATLTMADIDAFAQRMEPSQRPGFFNSPKRLESLISSLLVQRQLAAEAEKAGLAKDPSVQKQLELAKDEVLSKARMDQFRADLKLPDFEKLAREEYIGHKEKYVKRGKLDVKHVLISTEHRSDEEAKTLADDVHKQAVAHPDQFDALVDKYSEDPSKAQNHGLMTDASSKRYVSQFSDAASALKMPGEISPVTKTRFGYHVLKLIARTSDAPETFDQVKAQIVEDLRTKYVQKQLDTHTDELRNQPVDAKPEIVASLRDRYGAVQTPDQADETAVQTPQPPQH